MLAAALRLAAAEEQWAQKWWQWRTLAAATQPQSMLAAAPDMAMVAERASCCSGPTAAATAGCTKAMLE